MGLSTGEYETIREQLTQCSEPERESLVAALVAQGKLEQTESGVRYVFESQGTP